MPCCSAGELRLQRRAHLAEVELDRARQVGKLLLHAGREVLQLLRAFFPVRACRRLRELRHARDLLPEPHQLLSLHATEAGDLLHEAGLQLAQARAGLHAQRARGGLDRRAQLSLQPLVAARKFVEPFDELRVTDRARRTQHQDEREDDEGNRKRDDNRFVHAAMIRLADARPLRRRPGELDARRRR